MLVDTHAHIQFSDYSLNADQAIISAKKSDVAKILCVGTDEENSELAIKFAKSRGGCYPTVGLHPHEAKKGQAALDKIAKLAAEPEVVAIGECGLDYYYNHSSKTDQEKAFRFQIELALKHNKPLIFHVRDSEGGDDKEPAFEDFFRIVDEYKGLRGVVHSFSSRPVSSSPARLEKVLNRGFYVSFNGIVTFAKDQKQLEAAKAVPLNKLLLETDSPFLTPAPFRGKINEPANVRLVAEFLAKLRGSDPEDLAKNTTLNAIALFGI